MGLVGLPNNISLLVGEKAPLLRVVEAMGGSDVAPGREERVMVWKVGHYFRVSRTGIIGVGAIN